VFIKILIDDQIRNFSLYQTDSSSCSRFVHDLSFLLAWNVTCVLCLGYLFLDIKTAVGIAL